jgi:hypothetical protein
MKLVTYLGSLWKVLCITQLAANSLFYISVCNMIYELGSQFYVATYEGLVTSGLLDFLITICTRAAYSHVETVKRLINKDYRILI